MGSFLILLGMVVLLLLPIYISIDLYFDVVSGKIGCQISLYERIKLLGGYFMPCAGGLAFHTSNKKAKLYTYKQIEAGRRQMALSSGAKITSIRWIAEISPEYLLGVWTIENIFKTFHFFRKESPILESTTFLRESGFRVFARASIYFNLWGILLGWIEYLFRRVKECRKRKSAT
jgi:hypothetical protein